MMADLAECWGWDPPIMNDMGVAELIGWRVQALERRQKDR